MKNLALLTFLPLSLLSLQLYGQKGSWGLKTGLYSNGQQITNVPIVVPSLPLYIGNYYLEYSRTTFGAMAFYDRPLLANLNIQAGLGFRQKGFLSDAIYDQNKGYATNILPFPQQKNTFHYLSSEVALQLRTNPKRTVGYLRIGHRLDRLLGFKSPFWGNNYGYFKKLDFNIFGAVGVEYALKKKWGRQKNEPDQLPLYNRPTVFFLELEGVPALFNVHKSRVSDVPFVQVTDAEGEVVYTQPFLMQKIVRNTSVGLAVGVRF
jgi:hypothetical protein